jgi:hypothetical protein
VEVAGWRVGIGVPQEDNNISDNRRMNLDGLFMHRTSSGIIGSYVFEEIKT